MIVEWPREIMQRCSLEQFSISVVMRILIFRCFSHLSMAPLIDSLFGGQVSSIFFTPLNSIHLRSTPMGELSRARCTRSFLERGFRWTRSQLRIPYRQFLWHDERLPVSRTS